MVSDLNCIHKLLHICMKRSRNESLTIVRKLEISNRVDNLPPGRRRRKFIYIRAEFEIPLSTVSTILKNKDSHGLRATP